MEYRILEEEVDGKKHFYYPQHRVFLFPFWWCYKTSYSGIAECELRYDSIEEAISFLERRQKKPTIKKKIHNLD